MALPGTFSRTWVVARTTYHAAARQPLFYILVCVFGVLTYASRYFTLFQFAEKEEEELTIIRETALASIMACGFFLAVVLANLVISEDIEKLTATTILSKSIRRAEYLVGKFVGLAWTLCLAGTLLTLLMVLAFWHGETLLQTGRAFETARVIKNAPPGAEAYTLRADVERIHRRFYTQDMPAACAGAGLAYLGVLVILALAVGIAPHTSLVVNSGVCLLVYVLGNFAPSLARALLRDDMPIYWKGVGWAVKAVVPALGLFNVSSLLAVKAPVSIPYLAWSGVYGLLAITAILSLSAAAWSRKEIR